MDRALARSVALALAARVAVCALWPTTPSWDGHYYARLALRLAAGEGYVEPGPMGPRATAFWPPGYPAALSIPLRLGVTPTLAAVAVNLLAAMVACAAVVSAGRRLGGAPLAARAGALFALAPGLALWSTAAMTETMHGALLAVALLIALPRSAFGCGVALGLAALVRPPSLLLVAASALRGDRPAARARSLGACALGAALALAPWAARNARALDGVAVVSTNGGSNLLIGATDPSGGYHRLSADRCARAAGEVARDRCWTRAALRAIADDPLRWLARAPLRLARTFAVEADPAAHLRWSARPPSRSVEFALTALCTLAWWALVALAWRGRGADLDTRVAIAGVASLALTHAIFLGADRYHLSLVPLLCPLAARGLR